MNAVMSSVEYVTSETHVERALLHRGRKELTYAYSLVWEGTTIASARVIVPAGASRELEDRLGLTQLLRALP